MAKSIKSRIDELVSKLGELPPPSSGFIKGKLVTIGNMVEALEEGAVVRDAESKIAVLEEELGNLKVELSALQTELEAFRAERKKQEEEKKRQEMPEIQFKILQGLPTEHVGDGATLKGISQRSNIPPDESAVHLNRLVKVGFAQHRTHRLGAGDIVAWYRTIKGDELVLAKRLAGEEEPEEKRRKHADLSKPEEIALLMTARDNGEGATEPEIAQQLGTGVLSARLVLKVLRKKEMATDGDEPQQTYGAGTVWWLLDNGAEYLAERDLL